MSAARPPEGARTAARKREGVPIGRIAQRMAQLKDQGRKALIPYVTAGFPTTGITPALMHGMVAAGADVIELGVPFSDPSADGPVIQKAGEQALRAGVGLAQVLEMVREFRREDTTTPIVLMGYANPIERYDQRHAAASHSASGRTPDSAFVQDAAQAGVDGLIVVDYPPEECAEFAARLSAHGLDLIFLLAPTSTDERIAQVAQLASGYVYYVSLKGVTGAATLDPGAVQAMLPRIRRHVRIPVGVGFGIRDAASARAVGQVADAVVIGTRIIELIEAAPPEGAVDAVAGFLREIRTALDS